MPTAPRALATAALLAVLALVGGLYSHVREHPARSGSTGDAHRYAGSAQCRACHESEFATWQRSQHAQAERALGRGLALRPPPGITSHAVIGVAPLVQFLIAMPRGHVQVQSLALDTRNGETFDVFADDRAAGEWGHWTGRGNNWNSMCASCHNTGFVKGYVASTDSYASTRSEQGVGCEACHGPAAAHAERPAGLTRVAVPVPNPGLEVCAPCHSRRSELTANFHAGARFADHFALETIGESNAFHADGQVHEESFEVNAFLGSAMHAAGVDCGDCHIPHSGALRAPGNALCQRCHVANARADAPDIDPREHTHHTAGAPGDACVDCHMPTSVFMQRDARRDHSFPIPDPLQTDRLGIPNACQRCHAGRGDGWISAEFQRFWNRSSAPRRAWATVFTAAQQGDVSAARSLAARLARDGDDLPPLLRASAIGVLTPFAEEPQVAAQMQSALGSDESLLRAAAARALAGRVRDDRPTYDAVRERLNDDSREVRIAAAWALRSFPFDVGLAASDLKAYLALHADQPSGQLRLAQYHAEQGDIPRAIRHFQQTIAWDPGAAAPRRDLALVLARQGDITGARQQLEAAVARAADDPSMHFELGLIRHEAGDLAGATAAFERAIALAPNFARAWLNLGLAYAEAGAIERALQTLTKGEAASTDAPTTQADIAYAAATLHAQRADTTAARAALERALRAVPQHAAANQLRARLSGPGVQ